MASFGVIGGVWWLWLAGYNMSVAVAVGFIALAGIAVETAIVMLIYIDHEMREHWPDTFEQLLENVRHGALQRLRPKLMTVFTTILGLTPAMIGTGTGAEIMQRIAAPMVGGLVTSTVHTLVMIPALYAVVQGRRLRRQLRETPPGDGLVTDDLALEPLAPRASTHDAPPAP